MELRRKGKLDGYTGNRSTRNVGDAVYRQIFGRLREVTIYALMRNVLLLGVSMGF
jgi:predicted methyltransferase